MILADLFLQNAFFGDYEIKMRKKPRAENTTTAVTTTAYTMTAYTLYFG